jgi:predicted regulator of Ras-like GTPase activity (Roadblock/LC7/MglB family)
VAPDALATLCKTDGVIGALVLDELGACLADHLPPPYEPLLFLELVGRVLSVFDLVATLDEGEPESLLLDCEEGGLVLRRLDREWLMVWTRSEVNLSLLNVALNVAALNLQREGRRNQVDNVPAAVAPRVESVQPSGGNASELPADAVPHAVLRDLVGLYAEYLGPAAKPVFKQQLSELGATVRSLRQAQLTAFVAQLTKFIPRPEQKQAFSEAVRAYRERALLI